MREIKAKITLKYDHMRTAKAIAQAVSPDNVEAPADLSIKTWWSNSTVFTEIACENGLLTFVATIDDLLFCISSAEKALRTTRKLG